MSDKTTKLHKISATTFPFTLISDREKETTLEMLTPFLAFYRPATDNHLTTITSTHYIHTVWYTLVPR